MAKVPRREGDAAPQWLPGTYPPGMPYGYTTYYGAGVPGHPMGYPAPQQARPTPTPAAAKPAPYPNGTTPPIVAQQSQSSAGTSRNTPSQSDSDSSQDVNGTAAGLMRNVGPGGLAKKKKPSLSGGEKRVSFAEKVSKRSPSPHREPEPEQEPAPAPPTAAKNEYNPWVKGQYLHLILIPTIDANIFV